MRPWIDVATLTKTKNLDGSFVVRGTAGLPLLLGPGMQVALVPPQTDCPRDVAVLEADCLDDYSAVVTFSGIDDASTAKALVGCHCLVRRELLDLDALAENPLTWTGWSVVDAELGLLGTVSDLIDNPGQALLEVTRAEGVEGASDALLVPVVDEFVRSVDPETRTIGVRVPPGLVQL